MFEDKPITITTDDVQKANQLSLHCPICAGAVENHAQAKELMPVVCQTCGTLYHKACWQQSGGKCAILGCGSKKYRPYGQAIGPIVKITHADLPKAGRSEPTLNGRQKQLKAAEQRRVREQQGWFRLAKWFRQLLRSIKILE